MEESGLGVSELKQEIKRSEKISENKMPLFLQQIFNDFDINYPSIL